VSKDVIRRILARRTNDIFLAVWEHSNDYQLFTLICIILIVIYVLNRLLNLRFS